MAAIKQKGRQAGILIILIGCLLLFGVSFVDAQNNTSDMSINELLFIQGIVKYISLDKQRITVKPSKEERVKIYVDEQTDFVGMSTLEELAKEQRVKVWYTPVGDVNIAVTVERLPDLGC
ncbi:MAG: hypothetical protein U9R66_13080 [Thermodesulfobacteriota bacterium]|nr:hypothetical protein [Thermodesulfobacteriota bacterium]